MDLDLQVFHAGSPLGTPKRRRTSLPVCSTPIENCDLDESCGEEEDVLTFLRTLDEFINSCNTSLSSSTYSEEVDLDADFEDVEATGLEPQVFTQSPKSVHKGTENADCELSGTLKLDLGPRLTEHDGVTLELDLRPRSVKNAAEDVDTLAAPSDYKDTEEDRDDVGTSIPARRRDDSVQIITDIVLAPERDASKPGSGRSRGAVDDCVAEQNASHASAQPTVTAVPFVRAVDAEHHHGDEVEVTSLCLNFADIVEDAGADAGAEDTDVRRSVAEDTLIDLAAADAAVLAEVTDAGSTKADGKIDDEAGDGDKSSPVADANRDTLDVTLVNDNTPDTAICEACSEKVVVVDATNICSSRLKAIEEKARESVVAKTSIKLDPALSEVLLIGLLMCPSNAHCEGAGRSGDAHGYEKSDAHLLETGAGPGRAGSLGSDPALFPMHLGFTRRGSALPVLAAVTHKPTIFSAGSHITSPANSVEAGPGGAWPLDRDPTLSPVHLGFTKRDSNPPFLGAATNKPAVCSIGSDITSFTLSLGAGPGDAWPLDRDRTPLPTHTELTKKESKPPVHTVTAHKPAVCNVGSDITSRALLLESSSGRALLFDKDPTESVAYTKFTREVGVPSVLSAAVHEPAVCSAGSNVASPDTCSKPTYFTEISRSFQETLTEVEEYHVDWVQDNSKIATNPTPGKTQGDCGESEALGTPTKGLHEGYQVNWARDSSAVASIPTPGLQEPKTNLLPRYHADWSRDNSTLARIPTPGPPGVDEEGRKMIEGKYDVKKSASFSLEKWLETSLEKEDRVGTPQTDRASTGTGDEKPGDVLLLDLENDDVSFVDDIPERHSNEGAGAEKEESPPRAVVKCETQRVDDATADLRHKINSLRSGTSFVAEEPLTVECAVKTIDIKTEVQEVRRVTPVKAAPPGRSLLVAEPSLLVKLEFPSKDVPQEPVMRQPFFSEDPEENDDNANPAWENIRQLTTEEERYEAVRTVWHNETVPDPHCNLSRYRHAAKQQGQCALRKRTLGKGHKRKASGSACNNPAKRRRMDTDIFDLKLKELERKTNNDYSAAQHALELNLQRVREQVNSQMANYGYGHRRSATAPWDMRYWQQHQEELLHYKFMTDTQNIRNKYSARASRLLDARHEVRHFNKFYVGLSGSDPTTLTDWQMAEQLKIEKILGHFKLCYREAKG